jgi:hypothetical protein
VVVAENIVRWSSRIELLEASSKARLLRHSCESRNPDSGPRIKSGVTVSFPQFGRKLWQSLQVIFARLGYPGSPRSAGPQIIIDWGLAEMYAEKPVNKPSLHNSLRSGEFRLT